ncbi:MAG: helix-turn-helix domain-containing protein [Dehalococcoidales bacterium]|nr:helix-turn-helix domain-containing protein [Dehalococcoidales bacterium]
MPGWKFLTNHALVLCLIAQQSRITGRDISSTLGITEKATRNIIADLEADGYVTKKKEGRRIKYRINPDLPLRSETQQNKAIGDLLEVLGWRRRKKPAQKPVLKEVS